MEITNIRTDADLYGYSAWLAAHLGYKVNPRPLRHFQHGWIWWDHEDMPYLKGFGLDPNVNNYWGTLVQDNNVRDFLAKNGVYAKTCGLPFISFLENSGLKGMMALRQPGSVLYIPTHSNPWNNFTEDIIENAKKFALNNKQKCSIMLAWNDRHAASHLQDYFEKIEIGAGALEGLSFYRMMRIFETYEFMITDSPGSHICYALACGMHVGLHEGLYNLWFQGKNGQHSIDSQRTLKGDYAEQKMKVMSLEYMESKFPGIVTGSINPTYNTPPAIKAEQPHIIANALGWDATYPSDLMVTKVS